MKFVSSVLFAYGHPGKNGLFGAKNIKNLPVWVSIKGIRIRLSAHSRELKVEEFSISSL